MKPDPRSAVRAGCPAPGAFACSRRELFGLGALASASALALGAGLSLPACSGPDPLERALRGFFRDAAAARAVGQQVLELEPQPTRASDWLARVARERAAEWRELARGDPQRLAEALRAQSRDDFARGRVLVVRGWVLSETECGIAALGAL